MRFESVARVRVMSRLYTCISFLKYFSLILGFRIFHIFHVLFQNILEIPCVSLFRILEYSAYSTIPFRHSVTPPFLRIGSPSPDPTPVEVKVSRSYLKIPKICPEAYIFQRPFLRGLYSEGLVHGGKFAFQNRLGHRQPKLTLRGKSVK